MASRTDPTAAGLPGGGGLKNGGNPGWIGHQILLIALVLITYLGLGQTALCAGESTGAIHQGDLVLESGNVTTIRGRLDINGSLILRGDATLILEDAQIKILQTAHWQHSITLGDPLDGSGGVGPSIRANNSSIESPMALGMRLYGASHVSFHNVTTSRVHIYLYDAARLQVWDSDLTYLSINDRAAADINATHVQQAVSTGGASDLAMLDSRMETLSPRDASVASLELCKIELYLMMNSSSVDCLIEDLAPRHATFWEFSHNCSATPGPAGTLPLVTLRETEVAGWGFRFYGSSNAEIRSCELRYAMAWDESQMGIADTTLWQTRGAGTSTIHLLNSTSHYVDSVDEARVILTDSTGYCTAEDLSTIISKRKLEALVADSQDRAVPQAEVRAWHPNQTLAASATTDQAGVATLLLNEWTANQAGRTPSQLYTIKASYGAHQAQAELNITASQRLAFKLQGLTIPEQAGPWQAAASALLIALLFLRAAGMEGSGVCRRP